MKLSPLSLHRWVQNLLVLGLALVLLACAPKSEPKGLQMSNTPQTGSPLVFVGTYTRGPQGQNRSEGIFVYRMDPSSGALALLSKAGGPPNPSFLTVDPSHRYLIAVSETGEFNGEPGGGVSSYAINAATGELKLINSQPTRGADPCYVTVDPTGKWVLVSNYSGGSVTVLPLGEDGQLGSPTDTIQHHGFSVNPDRQAEPHAHSVQVAPGSGKLVLAADLGLDRILLYDLDLSAGSLSPHAVPYLSTAAGSGPRHMAFYPGGRYLYVASEMGSTISAYQFDPSAQTYAELQTLSTLPEGYSGQNSGADIHISPSGKFLYTSNRGQDSLAVFAIDAASGKLTALGQVSTQGKTPRNFAIDPTGTFILAANQDSGSIVTLKIDAETGLPAPAGPVTNLPMPVCVQFFVP